MGLRGDWKRHLGRNGETARLEARATSGTFGIAEIPGLFSGELTSRRTALDSSEPRWNCVAERDQSAASPCLALTTAPRNSRALVSMRA